MGEAEAGYKGVPLDLHHARVVIAKLRNTPYAQVFENDPGVKLMLNKNMSDLRMYLQDLPLADLRLLDLKAYHEYRANAQQQQQQQHHHQQQMNGNGNGGNYGMGGNPNPHSLSPVNHGQHQQHQPRIKFPTINLNYRNDIKQFSVPRFGCFDEMVAFINSQWPYLSAYKMMYQDQMNGYRTRITTNIEIQEVIKNAYDNQLSFVDIDIVTN